MCVFILLNLLYNHIKEKIKGRKINDVDTMPRKSTVVDLKKLVRLRQLKMPKPKNDTGFDFEKWINRFEKRHLEAYDKSKYEKCLKCLIYVFGKKKKKKITFKQIAKVQRATLAIQRKVQRLRRLKFSNVAHHIRKLVQVQFAFRVRKKVDSKLKFKNAIMVTRFVTGLMANKNISKIGPAQGEIAADGLKDKIDGVKKVDGKLTLDPDKISEVLIDEEKAAEFARKELELQKKMEAEKMDFFKIMKMRRIYSKWKKYASQRKEFNLKRTQSLVTRQTSIMKDLQILDRAIKELKRCQIQIQMEIQKLNPKFQSALKLTELPKFDQTYLQTMRFNPPVPVQILFAGICMIKGVEPIYIINGGKRTEVLAYDYLKASRSLIASDLRKNLDEIRDPKNIHEENFARFRELIFPHPEYDKSKIEKSFSDVVFLFDWIAEMEKFAVVSLQIKEREEAIEFAKTMEEKLKKGLVFLRSELSQLTESNPKT